MTDISQHVPSPPPQWVKNFARFGLTAKGVVYCLVGALAFMAAFEIGNESTNDANKNGAFRFIISQPYGIALLALVAVGLACYAIWRFIQAIKDTTHKGSDTKGIGRRIGYAFSGAVYGTLAFYAAKMVLGNSTSGGSGDDSRQTFARELLKQPFGQWLVGIVAVGTIIMGLYQLYRAFSEKYRKQVKSAGLENDAEEMLMKAGKIGYVARGIVWMVIGYLFLQAALQANPNEAGGSSSAFQFLENSSYGSYILGAVALGLICYGVFMFLQAKYQATSF
ncbi:DUF1206 domain-containing protein [Pontibacter harenae]|uniref:DUF1206 domain-containing protein n=1 Tax=Pontibacter harenae TaxID=2894083 RepID=UPI001E531B9A|nr:DUF1206 domain-containing protein [Pontibacter harenae]MCC9168248.1 DUF1206 domain-containing protein [Pontibacter harenae]